MRIGEKKNRKSRFLGGFCGSSGVGRSSPSHGNHRIMAWCFAAGVRFGDAVMMGAFMKSELMMGNDAAGELAGAFLCSVVRDAGCALPCAAARPFGSRREPAPP